MMITRYVRVAMLVLANVLITGKTNNMNYSTMNAKDRALNLIESFHKNTDIKYSCCYEAGIVFCDQILLLLPNTPETQKEIRYWKAVKRLLKDM